MANEQTKSHSARLRAGDYEMLRGHGIDVCCGPDPLKLEPPSIVDTWDLEDGDAQYLNGIRDEKYDFLTCYHGLEHMFDPETAIQNWSRVIREGGSMVLAVPLYSCYEKFKDFKFGTDNAGKFNPDHKTSWDLINLVEKPKNHRHFGYKEIVQLGKQAGLTLVDLRVEVDNFPWHRWSETEFDPTQNGALAQLAIIFAKI